MSGTDPRFPIELSDVEEVLVRIDEAQQELVDVLHRVELRDVEWDRLAQASRALRRATHLLEGNSRIG
jgi:hypothetical protein